MHLNRNVKIKICIFIGLVFLVLADPASADTVTVNNVGEGDYKSIQKAINNANPGDTILVYPGTYKENLVVDRELRIISKSGSPEDTIVLAATQKEHVFKVASDNVTIRGFKIKDASGTPGNYKYGIYLDGTKDCIIDNNYISNNREGILLIDSSNNTASNNTAYGIYIGISSDNNTLKNNSIHSNGKYGIFLVEASLNNDLEDNSMDSNQLGEVLVSSDDTLIGSSELGTPEISSQEMGRKPGTRLREMPFIGFFMTIAIVGMASIIVKRKQG